VKESTVSVRVSDKDKKWLIKIGNGSISDGIERCIETKHLCEMFGLDDILEVHEVLLKYRGRSDD
jgi:hypothetical protein